MVYGGLLGYINAEGKRIGRFPAAQTDYGQTAPWLCAYPAASVFSGARRCGMKSVRLDDSFYFAMDYDLWTRLGPPEAPLVYIKEPWAAFRLHGTSKKHPRMDDRCWPEMMRAFITVMVVRSCP